MCYFSYACNRGNHSLFHDRIVCAQNTKPRLDILIFVYWRYYYAVRRYYQAGRYDIPSIFIYDNERTEENKFNGGNFTKFMLTVMLDKHFVFYFHMTQESHFAF